MYTPKADPQDQRESNSKQECIPVGCVPTAAVAATCSFRGFMMSLPVWSHVPSRRGSAPPRGQTEASENITFPCGRQLSKKLVAVRFLDKSSKAVSSKKCAPYPNSTLGSTMERFFQRNSSIYYYLKPTNRRLLPS